MTELSAEERRRVRREYLEERLRFTRENMERLQRDRRRIPWLFSLALLSIPAGIYRGWIAAALVLLGTVFTVASASYLVWGHGSEYRQKIAEIESELKRL